MNYQGLVALLFLLISVNEAKVFQRCELAKLLKKAGMDRYSGITLGDWICLTFYESNFNTKSLGGPNPDGGRNYGLFQINSRWWCAIKKGKPFLGCENYCGDFMDDDIGDDIACVKRIARKPVRMEGWLIKAWAEE
ncbi:lysozyme C, milk isozyme-like [Eublepharis macularius]|uniref:Lysozyme C, milk isozyme-like n=1 Tax=Eublepharis macularius TaxID=481883 RepID=A0AA97LKH7_EUBMA|nr:lysozyme C, milk isozyme-like [Eublepharis macularius]